MAKLKLLQEGFYQRDRHLLTERRHQKEPVPNVKNI